MKMHKRSERWIFFEAYCQCEIPKGTELTFGDIKDILRDKKRITVASDNVLLREMKGSAQYLELIRDNKKDRSKKVFKNTLGDHYGETYKRRSIDGRYTYIFEDGTYVH